MTYIISLEGAQLWQLWHYGNSVLWNILRGTAINCGNYGNYVPWPVLKRSTIVAIMAILNYVQTKSAIVAIIAILLLWLVFTKSANCALLWQFCTMTYPRGSAIVEILYYDQPFQRVQLWQLWQFWTMTKTAQLWQLWQFCRPSTMTYS